MPRGTLLETRTDRPLRRGDATTAWSDDAPIAGAGARNGGAGDGTRFACHVAPRTRASIEIYEWGALFAARRRS